MASFGQFDAKAVGNQISLGAVADRLMRALLRLHRKSHLHRYLMQRLHLQQQFDARTA